MRGVGLVADSPTPSFSGARPRFLNTDKPVSSIVRCLQLAVALTPFNHSVNESAIASSFTKIACAAADSVPSVR
jgi:hypothetical protein